MHIDHQGYWRKKCKLHQIGSERGHVTYFRNFGTPSISRERLELETLNLACRFITSGTSERNAKFGRDPPKATHLQSEMPFLVILSPLPSKFETPPPWSPKRRRPAIPERLKTVFEILIEVRRKIFNGPSLQIQSDDCYFFSRFFQLLAMPATS